MSKSNDFLPGAYDLANGVYTQFTFAWVKPSFFATAYTTADSKPLPVDGSLIFHVDPFAAPPPNHGGKAGLSVPTVSVPGWRTLSPHAAATPSRPDAVVVAASTATSATTISPTTLPIPGETSTVNIGRHDVRISTPEKLFFPASGLTKGDLVQYYLDVAPCALPHLRRRPFHMKRFPNGVGEDFFHQKRVPANHPPYVGEIPVSFPSGHSTVFAQVDNAAALAWVVNLGCVELHTWHSRVPELEQPDYLLIDLDPTSEGQWPYVRRIALVVREVMDELGLRSYPKTPGATGLHVLAPIRPDTRFPEVRRFAKALAEEVERRVGDQAVATTTWRVADRVGVFVDFGQNARDRTIAAAYSVRPVPDARVSAPLLWHEVPDVDPAAFVVETMRGRMGGGGDRRRGMWPRAVSLRPRFERLGLSLPD